MCTYVCPTRSKMRRREEKGKSRKKKKKENATTFPEYLPPPRAQRFRFFAFIFLFFMIALFFCGGGGGPGGRRDTRHEHETYTTHDTRHATNDTIILYYTIPLPANTKIFFAYDIHIITTKICISQGSKVQSNIFLGSVVSRRFYQNTISIMAYICFEAPGASSKKPPNREVLVKNFVVEKLYREHRRQVINSQYVVDDRLDAPERLMKKNPYKVLMQKVEAKKIENENHEIYLRMSRVEVSKSDYVNDQIRHHELVTPMKFHFDRLNKLDRERRIHAINSSNLAMLARLNRAHARPEITAKETEKWYRKHQHFKSAR
jgi:hypothetical protein